MTFLLNSWWRRGALAGLVLCALTLTGCASRATVKQASIPTGSKGLYEQTPLSPSEQQALIGQLKTQIGQPYVWGAQSPARGFDCSGLLVWSYERLGLGRFRYKGDTVGDVTADSLYKYNTYPLTDIIQLRQGDLIFFDPKNQGYETHVAVFSHRDGAGNVWVWDASSTLGRTSLRQVPNFWAKRPVFGRPMKLSPATSDVVQSGYRQGRVVVAN